MSKLDLQVQPRSDKICFLRKLTEAVYGAHPPTSRTRTERLRSGDKVGQQVHCKVPEETNQIAANIATVATATAAS